MGFGADFGYADKSSFTEAFAGGLVLLLIFPNLLCADIYLTYTVETDREVYLLGDTVHWRIRAGVEGETDGIAGLSITLYESMNEFMNEPFFDFIICFEDMKFHPTFVPESYLTTGQGLMDFNCEKGFDAGGSSAGAGEVTGIGISQFEKVTGVTSGALCEGVYVVTKAGMHTLSISHNSGYYWAEGTEDAIRTDDYVTYDVGLHVITEDQAPEGDVTGDLAVDLADVGSLGDCWFESGCGEENAFCDGADINKDGFVDYLDVAELASDWLWNPLLP